jgi:hypothetical protein
MSDKIEQILTNSLYCDNIEKTTDLIGSFKELYKVPWFKIGLDVILTKAELGLVRFFLQEKNITDNNHGCCITRQISVFNKIYKVVSRNYKYDIQLRTVSVDVIIHEIAHALEHESKINLNKDFAQIFASDINKVKKSHLNIQNAVKQIIFKELNLYHKNQHNSELLARFYELVAMSKEIGYYHHDYHFKLAEICDLFKNTIAWIENVFNANLRAQILDHIAPLSNDIKFDNNLGSFSRKYQSLHGKNSDSQQQKKAKWNKVIKSNFYD